MRSCSARASYRSSSRYSPYARSSADDGGLTQVLVARELVDHERGDVRACDATGHGLAVLRDAKLSARGSVDERRRADDDPFDRALADDFFLKLLVAELRLQEER